MSRQGIVVQAVQAAMSHLISGTHVVSSNTCDVRHEETRLEVWGFTCAPKGRIPSAAMATMTQVRRQAKKGNM